MLVVVSPALRLDTRPGHRIQIVLSAADTGVKTGVETVRSLNLLRCFHLKLSRVVATGRPVPSSISLALTAVCLATARQEISLGILLQAAPMMLVTMASFMMNDLWDQQKDARAGKWRPLC